MKQGSQLKVALPEAHRINFFLVLVLELWVPPPPRQMWGHCSPSEVDSRKCQDHIFNPPSNESREGETMSMVNI